MFKVTMFYIVFALLIQVGCKTPDSKPDHSDRGSRAGERK